MSRMRLWISAAIIAFIVLIIFALSVPHTRDVGTKKALLTETEKVPPVSLRDSFKKGVHTISGYVEAPNACALANASAILINDVSNNESLPAQAGILVAISMSSDSGICLQVPSRAGFQTTVSAPAGLPISATVNGAPASTTLP